MLKNIFTNPLTVVCGSAVVAITSFGARAVYVAPTQTVAPVEAPAVADDTISTSVGSVILADRVPYVPPTRSAYVPPTRA